MIVSLPGGEDASPPAGAAPFVSCAGVASSLPRLHAAGRARLKAMAQSVRRLNEVAGFMMEPKIIVVPSFVHATRSQPNAVLLYDDETLCWQHSGYKRNW